MTMLETYNIKSTPDLSPGGRAIIARQDFTATHIVLSPRTDSSAQGVETEFRKHVKRWKRDTQYLSSPTEKYLHPSYARIIGLGQPAIRLLLEELRREPDDWFYALRALTGSNPVTASMAGDMDKMLTAWLAWGARHGRV
jgi:hypothetical protein